MKYIREYSENEFNEKDYQNLISILEDLDWTISHFPVGGIKQFGRIQIWVNLDQISLSNNIIKLISNFDDESYSSISPDVRNRIKKKKRSMVVDEINKSDLMRRIFSLSRYKLLSFSSVITTSLPISLTFQKEYIIH